MQFLTKIDTERARRGITIKQLANQAGLSEKTVKTMLGGRNPNPNVNSVILLCKALRISVAAAFTDGNEVVVTVNGEDAELLNAIRRLPANGKAVLLDLVRYMAQ